MAASACGRDVKEAKNATEGDDDRLEEDGRLSGRSCRKLVMSTDIRKFKVQDEDLMVWNLM